MKDIVKETFDEMKGGLFARRFEAEMTAIDSIIGAIGEIIGSDFEFNGGMYVTQTKIPAFMPKDKFQELFASVVASFGEIEPDDLQAAIQHVENFHDCYKNTCLQLFNELDKGIRYFKGETSDIDLLISASAALTQFVKLIMAPVEGGTYDLDAVRKAGIGMIETIHPLLEDVYRNEEIPPYDPPKPTDRPISFPAPDPSEFPGHLPSKAEALNCLDNWTLPPGQCGRIFMHLDPRENPLFAKECIARLWGYSRRVCRSERHMNRQASRMPRIALCPFYDVFFQLVHDLFGEARQFETRELTERSASECIKSLNGSTFPLPRLMRSVLLYAPREYFSVECHHHAYLMLARGVLNDALDRISRALPMDSRLAAVPLIDQIKRLFNVFLDKLEKPATGTELSYAAEVDAIINPFNDAFLQFASVLKVVEDQIVYEKEHAAADEKVLKPGEYRIGKAFKNFVKYANREECKVIMRVWWEGAMQDHTFKIENIDQWKVVRQLVTSDVDEVQIDKSLLAGNRSMKNIFRDKEGAAFYTYMKSSGHGRALTWTLFNTPQDHSKD